MADNEYTGLTLTVRKTAEGSHYEAGVEVEGAWVRLGVVGSGEFELRLQEAAEAAAAAKSAKK